MRINSRKNEKRNSYNKAEIRLQCWQKKLNRGESVEYNSSLCTLWFMNSRS
jgi:hypothetical protein